MIVFEELKCNQEKEKLYVSASLPLRDVRGEVVTVDTSTMIKYLETHKDYNIIIANKVSCIRNESDKQRSGTWTFTIEHEEPIPIPAITVKKNVLRKKNKKVLKKLKTEVSGSVK